VPPTVTAIASARRAALALVAPQWPISFWSERVRWPAGTGLYDILLRETWLQTTLPLLSHQLTSGESFPVVRVDEREAHCTREICLV